MINNQNQVENCKTNEKKNKILTILRECFGDNLYISLILICSKSEYQIEKKVNLFKISQEAQKINNYPLINVKALTEENPFIKEIMINNINKYSKDLIKGQFRMKNKNKYKTPYLMNKSKIIFINNLIINLIDSN